MNVTNNWKGERKSYVERHKIGVLLVNQGQVNDEQGISWLVVKSIMTEETFCLEISIDLEDTHHFCQDSC